MSMEFEEYAARKRAIEQEQEEIRAERIKLRKENLRTTLTSALQAAGIDPSWAALLSVESESDIPRVVNELRARGVGGRTLNLEGIGRRLAAQEREANEHAAQASVYFGDGEGE